MFVASSFEELVDKKTHLSCWRHRVKSGVEAFGASQLLI